MSRKLEPQPLATLRASMACPGINLPYPILPYKIQIQSLNRFIFRRNPGRLFRILSEIICGYVNFEKYMQFWPGI
jgi:hypothetical protein